MREKRMKKRKEQRLPRRWKWYGGDDKGKNHEFRNIHESDCKFSLSLVEKITVKISDSLANTILSEFLTNAHFVTAVNFFFGAPHPDDLTVLGNVDAITVSIDNPILRRFSRPRWSSARRASIRPTSSRRFSSRYGRLFI